MRFGSFLKALTLNLGILTALSLVAGSKSAEAAFRNYCADPTVSTAEMAKEQCEVFKKDVIDPTAPGCGEATADCEKEYTAKLKSTMGAFSKTGAVFFDLEDGRFIILDAADCDSILRKEFFEDHLYIPEGAAGLQLVSFEDSLKSIQDDLKTSCAPVKEQTQDQAQAPAPAPAANPAAETSSGCSLDAVANSGSFSDWWLMLGLPLLRVRRRK